jgi:threonine dehydrogenase-like Zn-dependent dehydrogenase
MRAAVFRGAEAIVVDQVADPVPVAGQVLVKTICCGICGSDLHAAKFPRQFASVAQRSGGRFEMNPDRDVVFGHEFCCEIVEHGPGTTGALKAGTRVVSMPLTVRDRAVLGMGYNPEVAGGFSEYLALSERMLLPVKNGLSSEHAALTEPMAVGWHAVQHARLTKEDVPLVIGCGPVGLAVIAGLKIKGVGPIIAADFSPARRALAVKMGADIVVDPAEGSPYARWAEIATPEGYDGSRFAALFGTGPKLRPAVLFECVGVPGVINQMMLGAPQWARIVVVGVCMETDSFEPFFGIARQLNLQFVLGYSPEEFADSLHHIAEGMIDVSPLITGKVGLDGVAGAFKDLANPERHAKILVEPWR